MCMKGVVCLRLTSVLGLSLEIAPVSFPRFLRNFLNEGKPEVFFIVMEYKNAGRVAILSF